MGRVTVYSVRGATTYKNPTKASNATVVTVYFLKLIEIDNQRQYVLC